ncbi:MAG: lipopolysaccharide heptosyltransferase II [Chitinivibrionales bacterium]|nr:lipopolysaccharide heptosyltransferase II [Chitinivibrionales bacterium]
MRHVAVLMPNWIGDFVLALTTVLQKKILEPDSKITLIVPEKLRELAENICDLPIIIYSRKNNKEYLRSVQSVKAEHFQRIFILPRSFSSALFGFRTRIKNRRGIVNELRGALLNERLPRSLHNKNYHLLQEYSSVLEIPFETPEAWEPKPLDYQKNGAIVFCPDAQYGKSKRWSGFAALARKMEGESIVVIGGQQENKIGDEIAAINPQRIKNCMGQTTLSEALAIIRNARLVISNDSGLMHCAAFYGVPLVGIFCSTSPTWTRPPGKSAVILQSKVTCAPCFKKICQYGHYHCLESVTVTEVLEAMQKLNNQLTP